MLTGLYPLKDNINNQYQWLPKCHHTQRSCESWKQVHPVEDIGKSPERWAWLNSVIVADAYTDRTGLGQVANGKQTTQPMESKEVRCGRNHSYRKRGIAASHVRVVDYVSSRISAKVSCSLALPSPDSSSVCANSLRLIFCSTQVSLPKIKI